MKRYTSYFSNDVCGCGCECVDGGRGLERCYCPCCAYESFERWQRVKSKIRRNNNNNNNAILRCFLLHSHTKHDDDRLTLQVASVYFISSCMSSTARTASTQVLQCHALFSNSVTTATATASGGASFSCLWNSLFPSSSSYVTWQFL